MQEIVYSVPNTWFWVPRQNVHDYKKEKDSSKMSSSAGTSKFDFQEQETRNIIQTANQFTSKT